VITGESQKGIKNDTFFIFTIIPETALPLSSFPEKIRLSPANGYLLCTADFL
jgi:hypothetical protein